MNVSVLVLIFYLREIMVELWFPTPIYYDDIVGETFTTVQDEFDVVFKKLIGDRVFEYLPDWNSHLLSDTKFEKNLIEEYNLDTFKQEIDRHVDSYLKELEFPGEKKYKITASWMSLYQKGDYAHIHCHGDADIAGVYYFKSVNENGKIFFDTPVKTLTNSYCFKHLVARVYYPPKEGRILLFPSWADHGVQTMTADGARVAVSFNLTFER